MSEYTILNSHQWRKCHKETCCCSGNYVVLNHNQFIGEFNTEEEAEKFIIGTTLSVGTLERDSVEISVDIKKIEPLTGIIIESRWSPPSTSELTAKLNEVIENQNKIIDYLNGMVKK